MFKIYIKNNYLFFQDLVSLKQYQGLAKNVFIFKDLTQESIYDFEGLDSKGMRGVDFTKIVDENNNYFNTEEDWIDFYTLNTGNCNDDSNSSPLNTFTTSTSLLQTPTGELVYMQTLSDGTSQYINPDGTPYTGNVTLLLPYSSGGEKQLILPITDFIVSGSFDYTLTKTVHGIEIINSVEMGTGVNTLSSITNYTITPTGDLIISTNSALTTEIVRITGNN